MNKPQLQQQLQAALNLPDSDFYYYRTDLYVLFRQETHRWLKENYKSFRNIQSFIGNKGTEWEGKTCLDIPFAGVWPE